MTTLSKIPVWQQDEQGDPIPPPQLPPDFILRAEAIPLMSVNDGRWIARVYHSLSATEGLLIFEDQEKVVYLTPDEAISSLAYFIREAAVLIPLCDATLSQTHLRTIQNLHALWLMEEKHKARAVLAINGPDLEKEGQR